MALALLCGAGCGLFDPTATSGGGGGGGGGGGAVGFGKPTVEVTINGVHFGPSAPDNGSVAQLSTTRDGTTGAIIDSTFRVVAASNSTGASCSIALHRQGEDVAPIGVHGYMLEATGGDTTPDGTVDPIAGEGVVVPQGQWQCTGSSCNGATFVLTALDGAHAEGFIGGTFQNFQSGTRANVVCSFYVPVIPGS